MFMGPLDASRPWNTADIVGVHRFIQRLWRNLVDEETGAVHIGDDEPDDETRRQLHRTIAAVRDDMASLRFNTAVARLFELNNHLTQVVQRQGSAPREVAEPLVLMTAPLAPHVAEELWSADLRAVPGARREVARHRHRRSTGPGQRQGPSARHGAGRRRRSSAGTVRPR
jgi:leucyl-tRNA synthetase